MSYQIGCRHRTVPLEADANFAQSFKNSDIVTAGDFNISLLKITENNIVGEFFDMLISSSFYPHITLLTRFSNDNGTLIDNMFCRIDKYAKQPKSGILTKQLSDRQPCFTFINNVQLKDKPPTYVK